MRRLFPIVLVALVATACGSDGEADGAGQEAPEAEATIEVAGEQANDHGQADVSGRTEAEVALGDVFFEPTVIVGEPGQTLSVTLENAGEVDHTFTITGQEVDVVLRPGASETAEVTFPDSGALLFECRFHAEAGMRGALSAGGDLSPGGDENSGDPGVYG